MIITLTSISSYDFSVPHYSIYPCKRIQQGFHFWYHYHGDPKWKYRKDPNNHWWMFYDALHNPPNEKISSLTRHYGDNGQQQIWAFHKLLKPLAYRTLK